MKMFGIKDLFLGSIFLLLAFGLNAQTTATSPEKNNDSLSCSTYLNGTRFYFKAGRLQEAYTEWKKAYSSYPALSLSIYIDGAPLLDSLIEKEGNMIRKQNLIDSLMKLYDDRMHYFGRDGYVMGRKAIEMYTYSPERVAEVNALLKKSIEIEGASTRPAVFVFYMSTSVELTYAGKMDSVGMYNAYDLIFKNVLEAMRVNQVEGYIYTNAFRNVEDYIRPLSKCDDYNKRFEKKYPLDSNKLPALRSMYKTMMDHKCYTSLFCKKLAKRVYSFDTLGQSALDYGKYLFITGEVNKSFKYLYDATKSENKDIAVKSYLALADSYRYMDFSPRAKIMVAQALELQPDNGNIYIYLGDAYRYAFEECGPSDLEKRAVYWIAADMYEKAAAIDPTVKDIASKRIADCNINFPTEQTLKKNGLKEGDTYKIYCWIIEDTKVRARK